MGVVLGIGGVCWPGGRPPTELHGSGLHAMAGQQSQAWTAVDLMDPDVPHEFDRADLSGDGVIDLRELLAAIAEDDPDATTRDAEQLLADLDRDGTGTICWDEFEHNSFEVGG